MRGEDIIVVLLTVKSAVQLAIIGISHGRQAQLNISDIYSSAGCMVLQALAVWKLPPQTTGRAQAAAVWRTYHHGTYCVLLLPLAKLVEGETLQQFADSEFMAEVLHLFGTGSVMLCLAPKLTKVPAEQKFWIPAVGSLVIYMQSLLNNSGPFADSSIIASALGMTVTLSGMMILPSLCPRSFTFGELCVVIHLLNHLVWRTVKWLILWFTTQEASLLDSDIYIFISVMLVFVTLASGIVLVVCQNRSILRFLLVYAAFAWAALASLQVITHSNPVLWLLNFILSSATRMGLLAWWFTQVVITAVGVALFSQDFFPSSHRETKNQRASSSAHRRGTKSQRQVSSSVRKAFHFAVIAVFVPGLAKDAEFLLLASVVAFAVLIVLETARLTKVQWLGLAVENSFQVFADEKDQGPVLLTHIYLLEGLSLPLWLTSSVSNGSLQQYAGVISLGIGDTFACLVGSRYGRIKWPGSEKTVEGTAAAIVSQLVFIFFISCCGWTTVFSWWRVVFAVLVCSVYEAVATQIDNLVLPLVMMATKL